MFKTFLVKGVGGRERVSIQRIHIIVLVLQFVYLSIFFLAILTPNSGLNIFLSFIVETFFATAGYL